MNVSIPPKSFLRPLCNVCLPPLLARPLSPQAVEGFTEHPYTYFMSLHCSDLGPTWGRGAGGIVIIFSELEALNDLNPAAVETKYGSMLYTMK